MPPMHDDDLPADPRIPQIPGSRRGQRPDATTGPTELAPERSADTPGRARRCYGRYGHGICCYRLTVPGGQ